MIYKGDIHVIYKYHAILYEGLGILRFWLSGGSRTNHLLIQELRDDRILENDSKKQHKNVACSRNLATIIFIPLFLSITQKCY